MIRTFHEAFEDGVEFCDWPVEKFREHARRNIADYFAGRRGRPLLEASRLTLGEEGRITGTALLNGRDAGPTLDLLMVRPGLRRRGIASTLVETAVQDLHSQGASVLRSAYCVSNRESTRGIRRSASRKNRTCTSRAYAGCSTPTKLRATKGYRRRKRDANTRLEALFKLWSHHTEELEKVAECERLEAVTPALRYSS